MPFNNDSDLINGQRNGPWLDFIKGSATAEGAGTWLSLWKVAGQPAAGANPPLFSAGSGYVPTKDTAGAIPFPNPVSPAISVLSLMDFEFAAAGKLQLCDRIWACSGFLTNDTTVRSVTTPSILPTGRDPLNGADVIPLLEVYSAPGATGATWTMTGVDALGNTGRTWVYAHPGNAETVNQMMALLPGGASPAAVIGCRQVTSFQCSVSSGTAGDVGVTLVRKLGSVVARAANDTAFKDHNQLGLRRVFDDACIMGRVLASGTSTGLIQGELLLAQN